MNKNSIYGTNRSYWNEKGNDFLGAVTLPKLGAFITDEKHGLFGDVTGKAMLEIGCGNGMSLIYNAKRGAAELWGMDISENQLSAAKENLAESGSSAKLICSSMDEECGIPKNHFDIVYSVYAIGWTVDLEETFGRIASYLKKDGIFIFSWTHPIHKCVVRKDGKLIFENSYFDEEWRPVSEDLCGGELKLANRKISTYINALAGTGFHIEKMIEETDEQMIAPRDNSDFAEKARMYPVTFVIKARKI